MNNLPFTFNISPIDGKPSQFDAHLIRRLSSLDGYFQDQSTYEAMLAKGDVIVYEVFEVKRPEKVGELLSGISVVHPGKVGDEFFFTKGHFHAVLDTAEIYYCLHGKGVMVMETPEGEWAVEEFVPGRVLYVPPRWSHRSVNTALSADLVTFFIYPGDAGHDYGTIETKGYRKTILKHGKEYGIFDNPNWKNP
jgi:glucose-6-phosphate isomerase